MTNRPAHKPERPLTVDPPHCAGKAGRRRSGTSGNHGERWQDGAILHDDPGSTGDIGYSSTAELADGSLLTIWQERLQGETRAVLKTARWNLTRLCFNLSLKGLSCACTSSC